MHRLILFSSPRPSLLPPSTFPVKSFSPFPSPLFRNVHTQILRQNSPYKSYSRNTHQLQKFNLLHISQEIRPFASQSPKGLPGATPVDHWKLWFEVNKKKIKAATIFAGVVGIGYLTWPLTFKVIKWGLIIALGYAVFAFFRRTHLRRKYGDFVLDTLPEVREYRQKIENIMGERPSMPAGVEDVLVMSPKKMGDMHKIQYVFDVKSDNLKTLVGTCMVSGSKRMDDGPSSIESIIFDYFPPAIVGPDNKPLHRPRKLHFIYVNEEAHSVIDTEFKEIQTEEKMEEILDAETVETKTNK